MNSPAQKMAPVAEPTGAHSVNSVSIQKCTTTTGPVNSKSSVSLGDVYEALGYDAILLPLKEGKKMPVHDGWPKTTLAKTYEPAYQQELRKGDIGVLMGEAGNRDCGVDCDTDAAAAKFIAANPRLASTLRTRGARGCTFWIKVSGGIPGSCTLSEGGKKIGEWRAAGNQCKIAGIHPDTGRPYEWLVPSSPVEIAFEDIVWPEGWTANCIKSDFDRLVEKYGIPHTVGKTGGVRLNQTFFAAKLALEHGILFEAEENRFYLYDPRRGLWQTATEAAIKTMLLADLRDYSQTQDPQLNDQFALARTDQWATSVVRVLRGQVERRGVFSKPRRLVHVSNGMIEIGRNGMKLLPFAVDHFSRNQVPVEYDPAAKCPRFHDELLSPALAADDIRLLQKWLGGVLLGGNLAQKMLVQEGIAGAGKGTFADIAGRLIGSDNVTQLRTEFLGERFEIARYVGKRLLAGRDVPGDFLNRRGAFVIKALTGGDDLDAEIKGTMQAPSLKNFDILITCNSRLRVRLDGDVDAWRRRLLSGRYGRVIQTLKKFLVT